MSKVQVLVRERENLRSGSTECVRVRIFTPENAAELMYLERTRETEKRIRTRYFRETAFGCQHQLSNVSLECQLCGEVFPCAKCHDRQADHSLKLGCFVCCVCGCKRENSDVNLCMQCGTTSWSSCCGKCCRFNFPLMGREYFHCGRCGKCIAGQQKSYYHCAACNSCVLKHKFAYHLCYLAYDRASCPFCKKAISVSPKRAACGCLMHTECYYKQICNATFVCPRCERPVVVPHEKEALLELVKEFAAQVVSCSTQHAVFVCGECGRQFPANDRKYAICPGCAGFQCRPLK